MNRGGNASNSLEFATAISSSAGVANCLVLHGGTTEETPNPAVAIPNIKDLNDFQFHSGGILVRKSSGYGTGKNIDFRNTAVEHFRVKTEFHPCDIMDEEKLDNWRSPRSTLIPFKMPGQKEDQKENESEIEDVDNVKTADVSQQGTLYRCPQSPCVAHFIRSDRLDVHMLRGIHKILKPHPTIKGKVTAMYISAFGVGSFEKFNLKQKEARSMVMHLQALPIAEVPSQLEQADTPLANANAPFKTLFPPGFALRQPSKRTTFTEDQLLFVEEKFDQGRPSTAKKAQPEEVVQEMREATFEDDNGNTRARFSPEHWLSEGQIRNLFSKLALNIRVGDIQDAQNDPPVDVITAEAAQATAEEQGNLFDANMESDAINEVKKLSRQDTDEDSTGHPITVRFTLLTYLDKSYRGYEFAIVGKSGY